MFLVGKALSAHHGLLPIVREGTVSLASLVRTLLVGFLICQFWGQIHAQCDLVGSSSTPLYWDANTEAGIDHYNVYRSSTSGSGYSVIGTTLQAPDPIAFTDIAPLATSYYVVTAVDTSDLESGFSNELCVQLSGGPTNNAPTAVADNASTNEDAAVTIDALSNDSDLDGDTLTVESVTQPTNGSVVINADQTVTYSPTSNFNGSDSFSYTVADGQGGTDSATVTLSVTALNDAPTAADDSASTNEDISVTIIVLSNDADVDGDSLTVESVTQPTNGSVVVNPSGTVTYTPVSNFNGSDSFSYTVADGQGATDTANVILSVTAVNDAPAAADDSATTNEDISFTIIVLSNDADADGDTLTVASLTQPANGSVVVNPSGTVTYTPVSNFNGSDSFSYTVADGQGGTDSATVTLSVTALNDAPTAADDSASTNEDISVTIIVLSNDADVDGDSLTVESVTQPTNGSVVVNPSGTVTYTPSINFNGSDSFSYTVADGNGATDTATVTVTVSANPTTDADSDGIDDSVEDQAPNSGDGNNDGILDSQQADVVSFPSAANGLFVTLVSQEGTKFVNVAITGNPSASSAPAEADFAGGFFDFAVEEVPVGQATTVILFLDPGAVVNTYWKFGPTPDNPIPHWYEFLYDGLVGAEILSDRIILHFVDGERGDDDLAANGEIRDQGGPAFSTPAVIPVTLSTGVTASDDTFVGMAILNPNDYPNEIFLSVVDPSGIEVDSIDLVEMLPARGQTAFLTREVISASSSELSVIVRGRDGPIQSFFLIGDYGMTKLDGM